MWRLTGHHVTGLNLVSGGFQDIGGLFGIVGHKSEFPLLFLGGNIKCDDIDTVGPKQFADCTKLSGLIFQININMSKKKRISYSLYKKLYNSDKLECVRIVSQDFEPEENTQIDNFVQLIMLLSGFVNALEQGMEVRISIGNEDIELP